MSLERILICPCGHYLEWHDVNGCRARAPCECRASRTEIVDWLVRFERDEIRSQWGHPDRVYPRS